jgi:hypothetical protein
MEPLILKNQATPAEEKSHYEIINSPPWAQYAFIEFYDIAKFRVKLHIRTTGAMKDHAFSTAAYSLDYTGRFTSQLQDLSIRGFGYSGSLERQAVIC